MLFSGMPSDGAKATMYCIWIWNMFSVMSDNPPKRSDTCHESCGRRCIELSSNLEGRRPISFRRFKFEGAEPNGNGDCAIFFVRGLSHHHHNFEFWTLSGFGFKSWKFKSRTWLQLFHESDVGTTVRGQRGLPYMMSAKFSDFWPPPPLSANSCNLPYLGCLLCLFLKVPPGPLPPQWGRHKWKPPKTFRGPAGVSRVDWVGGWKLHKQTSKLEGGLRFQVPDMCVGKAEQ